MNSYIVNIVFPSESSAQQAYDVYQSTKASHKDLLELTLAHILKVQNTSDYSEINIETFKKYTNELEIASVGSKYPSQGLIDLFLKLEIQSERAIKLMTIFDDRTKENYYFLDGMKCSSKKFQSYYKNNKIPDPNVELIRHLKSYNFQKASSIVDQCDLSSIKLDHDSETWQYVLFQEEKFTDLTVKLLNNLVITECMPGRGTEWLGTVIRESSVSILKHFLKLGYRKLAEDDGESVFNLALDSETRDFDEKINVLFEYFPEGVSLQTELGTPLWKRGYSIPSCEYLTSLGAKCIPPYGFYESLSPLEKVNEAAKHNDISSFKAFYQPEYRDVALFQALKSQSFDVLNYLNQEMPINWLKLVSESVVKDSNESGNYEACTYYDLVLESVKYDQFLMISPRIIEMLKAGLPSSVKTAKSEKMNFCKERVADAKRAIARYDRWAKRFLIS